MTWWRLCGGCGNLQLDITGEGGLWRRRRDGVGDAEMEGLNLITNIIGTRTSYHRDNHTKMIIAETLYWQRAMVVLCSLGVGWRAMCPC